MKKLFFVLLASMLLISCGNGKTDSAPAETTTEENATTVDNAVESTPAATGVDALLDKLEGMLNQFAQMDDESDAYDAQEDKIMDLCDELDDLDMTPAQEARYEKLEDRFDDL